MGDNPKRPLSIISKPLNYGNSVPPAETTLADVPVEVLSAPADIEAHVRTVLAQLLVIDLDSINVWLIDSSSIQAYQFAHKPIIEIAYLQVDCRSRTKESARELAFKARNLLRTLPMIAWPEGFVTTVTQTAGPAWLADPADGSPRYWQRVEIHYRSRSGPIGTPQTKEKRN